MNHHFSQLAAQTARVRDQAIAEVRRRIDEAKARSKLDLVVLKLRHAAVSGGAETVMVSAAQMEALAEIVESEAEKMALLAEVGASAKTKRAADEAMLLEDNLPNARASEAADKRFAAAVDRLLTLEKADG